MQLLNASFRQKNNNSLITTAKHAKLANTYEILEIYYCISTNALFEKYKKGQLGEKSKARSSMFLKANDQKNCQSLAFAFLLAVARAGFNGLCTTQDIISQQIALASGRKQFSERTWRRCLTEFVKQKWVYLHLTPTGSKCEIAPGKYTTKRVNQIRFTPFFKALLKPLSYPNTPRPKRPTVVLTDTPKNSLESSLDVSIVLDESKKERSTLKSVLKSNENTTQRISGKKCTIKQKALNSKQRPLRKRGPIFRRQRNQKSSIWDSNRLLFLHELTRNLVNDEQKNSILSLVEIQTNKNFPPLASEILPWDKIIFQWHNQVKNWRDRRSELLQDIIPALKTGVCVFFPPNKKELDNPRLTLEQRIKLKKEILEFEVAASWLRSVSKIILEQDLPNEIKEYATRHQFTLDSYNRRLNTGQTTPNQIPYETQFIFRTLADFIGDLS